MEKTCTLKSNPSQLNLRSDEWYNWGLSLMAHFGPPEKRKLSGIKCVAETLNEILLVRGLVRRLETFYNVIR